MKRMLLRAAGVSAAALVALVGLPRVSAVVTSTWVVDDYASFDEGEAERAFITSLGEVRPGWKTSKTELEFSGSWAAVRGGDGTVYIGSDDDGAVYAVRGDGATKLATIEDAYAVVSLALGDDGSLYAGTMPAGQVWRVDTKSGKASRLAELADVETVWSLALARDGKTLYAGTGPDGKLFAVDPKSGKSRVAFDTEDKRIVALTAARDGSIWLGTSDEALVLRYDPARKTARAIADFAGNEVSALAEYRGGVIAAANDLEPPSTTGVKTKEAVEKAKKKKEPGQQPKMPKEGTRPGAEKAEPSGAAVPRKGGRKGKGALYRVQGDGQLTQLHALTSTYFTSVAVTGDGRIFAGAADKGRIYLVDADDSVSTAFDVEQRFVSQVLWDERAGVSFTTGDSAALYRTAGRANDAIYRSDVFDGKAPARFGSLLWRSEGQVAVQTRSGNTAEPGIGWSAWQATTNVSRLGGGTVRGKVASPPGRYFQYRVRLGSDDATLRHTELFYLPHNRPTRITGVEIAPEGAPGKKLVTLASGATKPRSPIVKVSWEVDNQDGDASVYRLEVRREGEARWRPLRTGGNPLTKTEYEWNTEMYPDGYYRLRVTASDTRANASERVIESHHTTALFAIDNQKPRVTGLSVKVPFASARASDAMSVIAEMAYSVDDGPWQVGATRDGLFDDTTEMLRIALPRDLDPGVHTLAVRVADAAGNVGSTSVSFTVD